jgi:hypothetical protein
MRSQSGGLLTIVLNDALAPPQRHVGIRPASARGRVGCQGEQIILDTGDTLDLLSTLFVSLDAMSAKFDVLHVLPIQPCHTNDDNRAAQQHKKILGRSKKGSPDSHVLRGCKHAVAVAQRPFQVPAGRDEQGGGEHTERAARLLP